MIPSKLALGATICAMTCMTGCVGTKTVLVQDGEPVRIRKPTKAKVFVVDSKGIEVPSAVTIPAGWFALPPPSTDAKLKPKTISFVLSRDGIAARPDTGIVTAK